MPVCGLRLSFRILIYAYSPIYIYTYVYIYSYIRIHLYIHIFLYMYTPIYTYIPIYDHNRHDLQPVEGEQRRRLFWEFGVWGLRVSFIINLSYIYIYSYMCTYIFLYIPIYIYIHIFLCMFILTIYGYNSIEHHDHDGHDLQPVEGEQRRCLACAYPSAYISPIYTYIPIYVNTYDIRIYDIFI